MDIWGSVTPPILVTENTSLGISVTIIKIRNKNKWFAYPSFGTLKRNKENFNIAIGDGNIGISKNCQPDFLWFFKLQYLLNWLRYLVHLFFVIKPFRLGFQIIDILYIFIISYGDTEDLIFGDLGGNSTPHISIKK